MELFCPTGRLKNKTQPQMRKEQMMDEYNNYENGYNQNPPPPRRPKKRMNARWHWIIPVLILAAILVMDSF